jgi:hypothetical protein
MIVWARNVNKCVCKYMGSLFSLAKILVIKGWKAVFNGFQRLLMPVYYWKTVEEEEPGT